MAFEFFFGILGLISSDSKSRHKSRLESEWRLPTPLNASLFRESGLKSPVSSFAKSGGGGGGGGGGAANDSKRPIFSTTGTLAAANSGSAGEGLFSSASNSSASSVASSGSTLTNNSSSAFIKPAEHTKKYEFRLNLIGGEKGAAGTGRLLDDGGAGLLSGLKTTTSSTADLISDGQLSGGGGAEEQEPDEGNNNNHNNTGSSVSSSASSPGSEGGAGARSSRTKQLRQLYCYVTCAAQWLHVVRLIIGLLTEKSWLTLDFYCLGAYRIHFLIPALCLAIQSASVSTLFIRNNDETNWLVPFYSSKDYLIHSRSNFKPKIEDYGKRVNVSIVLALVLALISSVSLSAYLIHCTSSSDLLRATSPGATLGSLDVAGSGGGGGGGASAAPASALLLDVAAPRNGFNLSAGTATSSAPSPQPTGGSHWELAALDVLLTLDVLWAVYSTYVCFLVAFYFNLICSIMKARFHGISKIIEDLAESNTTKTTNQARKITTLYLEHNEACELLDESNDFWQYLIFFTYFTYIPAYCYCLYNLFFVDFEAWASFVTWVIHTHTGFIILLISFSAAGVSTEAHAPYTSLHTLSLIQLPLDVEVNIATFLHRVRGLTIGYSCYDLFAITNASMSNTAAACASYFLIVADFSRSSVFTLAQMNGSSPAGGAAATTPTPAIG